MPAQDDAREQHMLLMFNLTVPPGRTRGGLDAILELGGEDAPVPFELKSTTSKSISTVRDMSPEHITKWRHLHWLFAFYGLGNDRSPDTCYYASPADMADWISEKEQYIRPDLVLADRAPRLLVPEDLVRVMGARADYSINDAKNVMKKQWTAQQYRDNADLPGHRYSPERMLGMLRQRCEYVLRRGATLNNPHISATYLRDRLDPITKDHAATLRSQVRAYLDRRAEQVAAGEVPAEDAVDPVVAQASAANTDEATA